MLTLIFALQGYGKIQVWSVAVQRAYQVELELIVAVETLVETFCPIDHAE